MDDPSLWRCRLGRGSDRLAPQRVDHQGWPLPSTCFPQSRGQVVPLEWHGRIGAQLERSSEPSGVAARSDDTFGPELTRSLDGNRAHGARCPEDEHTIIGSNRRPSGDGQPAGDACYSARGGDGVVEPVGHRNGERGRKVDTLDEEAVSPGSPPLSEQVQELPIATSDRLAAWHVGQRWMAAVEATCGDGEIDGVESDGDDLDRPATLHINCFGGLTQLGDSRSTHGGILRRQPTAPVAP